ncbi:MAG TPA: DUF5060 domain-containing protein [Bryobacteraceae bacterium]
MTRREAFLTGLAPLASAAAAPPSSQVERWGMFEASFTGPASETPYTEVRFAADFRLEHRTVAADGFYDGEGTWRVRFMPDVIGEWTYTTRSNRPELNGKSGSFVCTPPSRGNHGPVTVRNTWHFGYVDGTPYMPFGTTCYAWTHQGDELEEQTLATLKQSPFNKIRMCVFPKSYAFNKNEPPQYAFARDASGANDYTRVNPLFFRRLEKRVAQLQQLGIEADLILFHPYDRWGYSNMGEENDHRYLRYVVARLSAYRNVWWSMANEWDFVKTKKLADWDRFFRIVQESDPYQHLRSIHNGHVLYDHGKPWVTHASIQGDDFDKIPSWLDTYRKPIVFDECKYEGNIAQRWGNLPAHEMMRRFWIGTVGGAYIGHGETYLNDREILWWSKGGVLHGESAPRIAYLRKLVEENAPGGLTPLPNPYYPGASVAGQYYLYFLDYHQPALADFDLPAGAGFLAGIIDPWNMTMTPVDGVYQGKFQLKLPGKPYHAVQFRRAG